MGTLLLENENAFTPQEAVHWRRALTLLHQVPVPLFAVLDAARDEGVRQFMRHSEATYQSLYEAPKSLELEGVAPYLLQLPRDGSLLERLLQRSWGHCWGIFLACDAPFAEVRRQLRRHLMVEEQSTGRHLYFRYYDPRVLRVFLPSCTPSQLEQFHGPIQAFYAEGVDGRLLCFPEIPRWTKA